MNHSTPHFLRNGWYVAGWESEFDEQLTSRVIIGESLLLFRDDRGDMQVMDNICPHRFAPLDQGRLVDGEVQCPYHGLRFSQTGQCVHNPNGNGLIPREAILRVFPAVEKHALVWVWMGNPDLADDTTIPDYSCHVDPEFAVVRGSLDIDAYYELITDNLMDLTHAVTVHEGVLGSEAIARGRNTVTRDGTTVWSNSWCPDGMAPPAWDAVFGHYGKPVDHWLNMRWDAPAHLLLDAGISPVTQSRAQGIWVYGTDILTPQTYKRTRYFWAISRTHHVSDPKFDAMWEGAIKKAFEGQDKPIIEAQQRMLSIRGHTDIDESDHAFINTDAGPVQARRTLRKLLEHESDGLAPRPRNRPLAEMGLQASEDDVVAPYV